MEPLPKENPPLTFWQSVRKHFTSWPELYIGLPLGILSVPLAALFVYALSGHEPQENMDWILDFAGRLKLGAFVIVFASLARQATGVWLTKEEYLAHPFHAALGSFTKAFYLLFFAWLFTR
jgi:hypothetical protein